MSAGLPGDFSSHFESFVVGKRGALDLFWQRPAKLILHDCIEFFASDASHSYLEFRGYLSSLGHPFLEQLKHERALFVELCPTAAEIFVPDPSSGEPAAATFTLQNVEGSVEDRLHMRQLLLQLTSLSFDDVVVAGDKLTYSMAGEEAFLKEMILSQSDIHLVKSLLGNAAESFADSLIYPDVYRVSLRADGIDGRLMTDNYALPEYSVIPNSLVSDSVTPCFQTEQLSVVKYSDKKHLVCAESEKSDFTKPQSVSLRLYEPGRSWDPLFHNQPAQPAIKVNAVGMLINPSDARGVRFNKYTGATYNRPHEFFDYKKAETHCKQSSEATAFADLETLKLGVKSDSACKTEILARLKANRFGITVIAMEDTDNAILRAIAFQDYLKSLLRMRWEGEWGGVPDWYDEYEWPILIDDRSGPPPHYGFLDSSRRACLVERIRGTSFDEAKAFMNKHEYGFLSLLMMHTPDEVIVGPSCYLEEMEPRTRGGKPAIGRLLEEGYLALALNLLGKLQIPLGDFIGRYLSQIPEGGARDLAKKALSEQTLHHACLGNRLDCVAAFLSNGIALSPKSVDDAIRKGHFQLIVLLRQHVFGATTTQDMTSLKEIFYLKLGKVRVHLADKPHDENLKSLFIALSDPEKLPPADSMGWERFVNDFSKASCEGWPSENLIRYRQAITISSQQTLTHIEDVVDNSPVTQSLHQFLIFKEQMLAGQDVGSNPQARAFELGKVIIQSVDKVRLFTHQEVRKVLAAQSATLAQRQAERDALKERLGSQEAEIRADYEARIARLVSEVQELKKDLERQKKRFDAQLWEARASSVLGPVGPVVREDEAAPPALPKPAELLDKKTDEEVMAYIRVQSPHNLNTPIGTTKFPALLYVISRKFETPDGKARAIAALLDKGVRLSVVTGGTTGSAGVLIMFMRSLSAEEICNASIQNVICRTIDEAHEKGGGFLETLLQSTYKRSNIEARNLYDLIGNCPCPSNNKATRRSIYELIEQKCETLGIALSTMLSSEGEDETPVADKKRSADQAEGAPEQPAPLKKVRSAPVAVPVPAPAPPRPSTPFYAVPAAPVPPVPPPALSAPPSLFGAGPPFPPSGSGPELPRPQ